MLTRTQWTIAFLLLPGILVADDPPAPALKPLPVSELKRDTPVDFEKEVLPVLQRNCVACHNTTDAESEVVLETPQTIRHERTEGPIVVAGKSGESRLFKSAGHLANPAMPPADNKVGAKPLSADELALLKLWIDQGAQGEVKASSAVQFQPLPPGINPIYAVAVSGDGQLVACGARTRCFCITRPRADRSGG